MRDAEILGAEIARRYRLIARLGEGPLGVSYAAKDADDRDVVVKLIARSRISDEAISEYIQTSAALAALGGPHLVRTLDVAHDLQRGLLVLVREPMRGMDVATLLAAAAPIEPLGALALVAQASAAVASAHAAGAVLRCVKPTNVFLEPAPGGEIRVRICDPAIAVEPAPRGSDSGSAHATDYVAPERGLIAGRADSSVDVYSLGALLYALLTGSPPRRDAAGRYRALPELAPWVGHDIARVVVGALAADTAARIAKASTLRDALRDAAGGDLTLRGPMLASVGEVARASLPPPPAESRIAQTAGRAPHADPLIGHKLGGRYVVVRPLGQGGMGAVYEVLSSDGAKFAAKIVAREEAAQTQLIARFLREAQAATRIVDPHVVRTVELGTDMTLGAPFIVMELLRGRDLASFLREHGALEPLVALRIFLHVARGLAAAHACGVVHRDIKPANIFLSTEADGAVTAKICDFGLAKAVAREGDAAGAPRDLTREGLLLGTPAYMSPEQAVGARDVDARSDIWSLCASMYEALGGERLWADQPAVGAEILHVIHTRSVRPLDEVAPWLDPAIVAIVHRGLERERRLRWQDAKLLVVALETAVSGEEKVKLDEIRAVDARLRQKAAAPLPEPGFSTTDFAALPHDHSTQAVERSLTPPRAQTAAVDANPRAPSETPRRSRMTPRRAALALGGLALGVGIAVTAVVVGPLRGRNGPVSSAPRSAAPIAPACRSNTECTRELGRAAICRPERGCAALETDECVVRGPDGAAENDATIWIGMMFPRTGEAVDTLWGPAAKTAELAVKDFNDMLGGIPDPRPGHPPRPLALMACDDSDDARGARSARHLLDDVGVPAIVGFRSSKEVIDLATAELIPRGVLAIATFNRSSLITSIPHPPGSPRLVWRLSPSNAQDAAPLSLLISQILEPELRKGALGPRAPMRVAVVRPDSLTGVGFEDVLLASLHFNGKSVPENGDDFRDFIFDPESAAPLDPIVPRLLAFRPHVIAYILDGSALVDAIERGWPADERIRPRYVLGGGLSSAPLQHVVEQRPDLANRLHGISTPARTLANVKLAAHYNHVFGAQQTPITTTPPPYDAIYLLAYAAMASTDATISGVTLSRGMGRLVPPGESLEVGPARVLEAFNTLRAGKPIALVGASGPLEFDKSTGDAEFDYTFECLALQDGRVHRRENNLRYDMRTRSLVGTFTCTGPN